MLSPRLLIEPTIALRRVVLGVLVIAHTAAVTVIFLRLTEPNADDIWNVELWGAWRPFASEVLLPPDTFLSHAPVNLVARLWLGDGIVSLTAATAALNAIGFLLVLNFIGFITRRSRTSAGTTLGIQILIGLLYAFVSIDFLFFLARPNYRNLEIGLFLFAVQLTLRVAERTPFNRPAAAGVSLLLGLFAFNDPMFLICGLAPCLGFIALRWLTSNETQEERRAVVLVAGGIVAFVLWRIVFGFAGIQISSYAPPIFSSLSDVPQTAARTIDFLLINFGAAFSDRDARNPGTLYHLARLGLLGLVLIGAWRFRQNIPQQVRLALGSVVIFLVGIMLANAFSSFGAFEGQNSRYLIPATGMVIVLAVVPLAFGADRYRRVLAIAILALTGGVGIDVVRHARGLSTFGVSTPQFDAMQELANELTSQGASSGYSLFWVALPTQYFAGQNVTVSSVECGADGKPAVGYFADLDPFTARTDRSFYVLWDHETPQCSRKQIIEAFGTPAAEQRYEFDDATWGHFNVLWFDGNIGTSISGLD
jgi:hypothetical protein